MRGYFANYFDNLAHAPQVKNAPPAVIPTLFAMRNGEPYTIDYSMSINLRASVFSWALSAGGVQVAFDGDFIDTLKWGGITGVTDELGRPIDSWTITSASGFDYTHAVPEPSALALLSVVSLLAPMARRR